MKVTNIGSETRIFEYQGRFKAISTPIGVSVTQVCIGNNFARFRYLTEKVIKNYSIYRDTYKNSSRAFALVKADFINNVDDATFIRIIDNILCANISNQQGTKGKK